MRHTFVYKMVFVRDKIVFYSFFTLKNVTDFYFILFFSIRGQYVTSVKPGCATVGSV